MFVEGRSARKCSEVLKREFEEALKRVRLEWGLGGEATARGLGSAGPDAHVSSGTGAEGTTPKRPSADSTVFGQKLVLIGQQFDPSLFLLFLGGKSSFRSATKATIRSLAANNSFRPQPFEP